MAITSRIRLRATWMDEVLSAPTARGWSIANDSRLAVLCVLPPAGSAPVREIVRRVLASGRAWAAVAKLEGREVVRICATHGEITIADVDELVSALEAAR